MKSTPKWFYLFGESEDANLVGGKGAGLSRMTNMGLPVPPGFSITTEAWRAIDQGELKIEALAKQALAFAKKNIPGFGEGTLVSVRSGAPLSMPGMMDTVLNVGAPYKTLDPILAYYHVGSMLRALGITDDRLKQEVDAQCIKHGVFSMDKLDGKYLASSVGKATTPREGETFDFPNTVANQILRAVSAVVESWDSERAKVYRETHGIDRNIGTAINIQTMVFGNKGGSGVFLTRNPDTGCNEPMIDWVLGRQGDVVVDGSALTLDAVALKKKYADHYKALLDIGKKLEAKMGDAQDIEFTIDDSKLWILQHRNAKRTPLAAARIAVELFREGIGGLKALKSIDTTKINLEGVELKGYDQSMVFSKGTPVSPKFTTGRASILPHDPQKDIPEGDPTILIRETTDVNDLPLMIKSAGIITTSGGPTCHAALVAREYGVPTVVSTPKMTIYAGKGPYLSNGKTKIMQGDWITLLADGTIIAGKLEEVKTTVENSWVTTLQAIQMLG